MGRLIDADKLRYKHSLNTVNTTMPQSFPCITKEEINKAPTVEAIPQADYENRLKADLKAILVELQLKIEENTVRWYVGRVDGKSDDVVLMETINDIIQQKINELEGE